MKGTIIAIVRRREGQNGGYGFIKDDEGQERFFHARQLRPKAFELTFDTTLSEGTPVSFTPIELAGGLLRAVEVERA